MLKPGAFVWGGFSLYSPTVDGLAAAAVAFGEVAALDHEVGDDAVEAGALEVQRLAAPAHALLARAQRAEVLRRPGHDVAVQAHHDAARGGAADGHVEEHLRERSGCGDGGGCEKAWDKTREDERAMRGAA